MECFNEMSHDCTETSLSFCGSIIRVKECPDNTQHRCESSLYHVTTVCSVMPHPGKGLTVNLNLSNPFLAKADLLFISNDSLWPCCASASPCHLYPAPCDEHATGGCPLFETQSAAAPLIYACMDETDQLQEPVFSACKNNCVIVKSDLLACRFYLFPSEDCFTEVHSGT